MFLRPQNWLGEQGAKGGNEKGFGGKGSGGQRRERKGDKGSSGVTIYGVRVASSQPDTEG